MEYPRARRSARIVVGEVGDGAKLTLLCRFSDGVDAGGSDTFVAFGQPMPKLKMDFLHLRGTDSAVIWRIS